MRGTRLQARCRSTVRAIAMTAALLSIPFPALASGNGQCLTVRVADEVVFPDGTTMPPGTLTLCATLEFSPVTTLHETLVNGLPVGLLRSRRGIAHESSLKEPYVLFRREPEGRLQLIGYAWPDGRRVVTYRLAEPDAFRAAADAWIASAREGGSAAGGAMIALAP